MEIVLHRGEDAQVNPKEFSEKGVFIGSAKRGSRDI